MEKYQHIVGIVLVAFGLVGLIWNRQKKPKSNQIPVDRWLDRAPTFQSRVLELQSRYEKASPPDGYNSAMFQEKMLADRGNELDQLFSAQSGQMVDWIGTVEDIDTIRSAGTKLTLRISDDKCRVFVRNEGELIKAGHPSFDYVATLSRASKVMFTAEISRNVYGRAFGKYAALEPWTLAISVKFLRLRPIT